MLKIFITLFYLIAIGVTSAQVKTFKVRGLDKFVTLKEGHCIPDPTLKHSAEKLRKIAEITKVIGDEKIANLSQTLAFSMNSAVSKGVDIDYYLHAKIIAFVGTQNKKLNKKERIQLFWEAFGDTLVCRSEVPGVSSRNNQHILKRLVDFREPQFVKRFMNGRKYPLNPNAIELVDGKPETLLDYLSKITENKGKYKNYDYAEIENLKKFLKKSFKAKTAAQLLEIKK